MIYIMTLTITWLLILTVCKTNGMCVSQEIQQFDDYMECTDTRFQYESFPEDGPWKTVTYTCKLKDGMQT